MRVSVRPIAVSVAMAIAGFAPAGTLANEPSPVCAIFSEKQAANVLGMRPVAVSVAEAGEEAAPYCMWASPNRRHSVKVQVWSMPDLQLIGMMDAQSYFDKLQTDYKKGGKVYPIEGAEGPGFFVEVRRPAKGTNTGSVVILRGERLLIADFVTVPVERVVDLARSAASKI